MGQKISITIRNCLVIIKLPVEVAARSLSEDRDIRGPENLAHRSKRFLQGVLYNKGCCSLSLGLDYDLRRSQIRCTQFSLRRM